VLNGQEDNVAFKEKNEHLTAERGNDWSLFEQAQKAEAALAQIKQTCNSFRIDPVAPLLEKHVAWMKTMQTELNERNWCDLAGQNLEFCSHLLERAASQSDIWK
jgi:hypothetical protein